MTVDEVILYLRSVAARPSAPEPDIVGQALVSLKAKAVAEGEELQAKSLWCLQEILRAQNLYLQAFKRLSDGEFYSAWCDFEQIEIALASLERNFRSAWGYYLLDSIKKHTANWRSLFPYKMFLSPEMVERAECSICHRPIEPRRPCGHVVGEIYWGEECHRLITSIDAVLGIAFVTNPVQKYSVVFMHDPATGKSRDHYRYDVVRYAANALREPFDDWNVERTTRRQPHSRFSGVGRNDPCPCESGKKYKKCCLPESGVLRPHLEFTFAVQPPPGTISERYIS